MSTDVGTWPQQASAPRTAAARAPAVGESRQDGHMVGRLARKLTAARGGVKSGDVVIMMRHLATLLCAGLQ